MEMEQSAPQPSAGQIPDLLKIGAMPVNTAMDLESDILDPVIANESFIRFTLPNKGILHSHSKIQFGLNSPANDAYLPINVGIASLIQRATLKIGNTTICEIDDFSHFTAYRSLFMANETMRERLQYQTGQGMSKEFAYTNEGEGVGANGYGGGASATEAKTICMNNGVDYSLDSMTIATGEPAATSELQFPQYLELKKTDTNACPTFQWSLSDFFPFLKIHQLPLYMMKEQINLEFVLQPGGGVGNPSSRVVKDADTGADSLNYTIDTTKTKMISDHIFYPQEMMIAYANANKKLDFSYVDYRLSKLSFAGTETGTQIRNVGGAGRLVSKIVWAMEKVPNNNDRHLTNKYSAQAVGRTYSSPAVHTDTQGTLTTNVKYNDRFLYPIDVDNNARHFHNVSQAEGLVPFVSREEYSNEGINLSTRKTVGYEQQSQLGGRFNWCAAELNRAERINSRGIELYFNYATLPTHAAGYILRTYVETIRAATLEDGYISCYFA